MHIGFVHPGMIDAEGAGSVHSASRLVYELADRGHEVTVYCRNRTEQSPSDMEALPSGITVKILDTDGGVVPARRFAPVGESLLERLSELERFDVLHSYVSSIPSLAKINNRISTPVINTLNGYGPICPKKDLYYMDAEPCRANGKTRCTKCVFNSAIRPEKSPIYDGASLFDKYGGIKRVPATVYHLTNRLQSLRTVLDIQRTAAQIDKYHVQADHLKDIFASFDFPVDRFHTVPNMLDERFLVAHESDFEEPYRLLYVGSLTRKKGVQRLLPVIEYLSTHFDTEYELTIVGDGYLQPSLEREAKNTELNVTITGHIPYEELPGVYTAHDTFVYPGIWEEPFARVFLEALATGTPIVGSRVGALDEISGDAGLVTDGSVSDIARGIYKLTETGDLVERSQVAKERARQYRPSVIVPQFERLYEEAMATDTKTTS